METRTPSPLTTTGTEVVQGARLSAVFTTPSGPPDRAGAGYGGVQVTRIVDQVSALIVRRRDGVGPPGVERLAGESPNPSGYRDEDPVAGKVKDQRLGHYGAMSLAK